MVRNASTKVETFCSRRRAEMLRSRKPAVVCDDQYRQLEYPASASCSAAKRDLSSTTSKRALGATSSVRSSGLAVVIGFQQRNIFFARLSRRALAAHRPADR